jgi:hypothetical protein
MIRQNTVKEGFNRTQNTRTLFAHICTAYSTGRLNLPSTSSCKLAKRLARHSHERSLRNGKLQPGLLIVRSYLV